MNRLKRKDANHRESIYPAKRPPPPPPPPRTTMVTAMKIGNEKMMTSSNKLLAGYMAYEYLTKGTNLAKTIDGDLTSGNERYKEITNLLMMKNENEGGIRIPGIVNPTQLVRWIQNSRNI